MGGFVDYPKTNFKTGDCHKGHSEIFDHRK